MTTQKNTLALAIGLSLAAPTAAFATNGYQLIGIGAYQKSLGGAVTANPGSAMTAVTNPAGMARIGKRADFSMEAFMPERDVNFSGTGGRTEDSAIDMYGVPAIGWTAPTDAAGDMYFGGGMYGTSGMGVDYAPTLMMPADPGAPRPAMYWDGYSNISFWQMAPTLAWHQNDRLSLGASLNIDYQSVAFRQRAMADTTGDGAGDTVMQNFDLGRSTAAFGLGASFGLMYDVNESLTVGASYKSEQEFSALEYQLAAGDISQGGTELPAGTYELDLDYPQQLAAGLAYRATPALTLSADIKWIEWSATMDKLAVKGPGGARVDMNPGWSDQTVYAVGVAYAVSERFNLRAGYNHADAPFDEDKVSSNLILPAIVEDHYTIGADYRFNGHWDLAVHFMYAPEETLKAPADDPIAPNAEIALGETSFGVNIGYRF